jgi:hypothetical protein
MIGSFASEGGRPAIFLPEQAEVLAQGFPRGFCFPVLFRSLLWQDFYKGRLITLCIVAEVSVGRKSIGATFWSRYRSQFYAYALDWPLCFLRLAYTSMPGY